MAKLYKSLAVFIVSLFVFTGVSYACLSDECRSGWYECQGGTMCCYGSGCPSQCDGCGECLNWEWGTCSYQRTTCMASYCSPYCCWTETVYYSCSKCVKTNTNCTCGCYYCTVEPPPPPNVAPVCTSVTGATPVYAGASGSVYTCSGRDSDGSIAGYSWTATGGSPVSGNGSNFTWTPPTTSGGTYNLTCTVRDNRGATDACPAYSVNVIPPVDVRVTVTVQDHSAACAPGGTAASNASVTIVNAATSSSIRTGTTNASGVVTFSDISRLNLSQIYICATYAPPSTCTSFVPRCIAGGAGNCTAAVNVPASGDMNLTYAFEESLKDPWVSAIDGDVYANLVGGGAIPCNGNTLSQGFTANLINLDTLTSGSAYARTFGGIAINSIVESNRGGFARNMNVPLTYLSKFNFNLAPLPYFTHVNSFAGINTVGRIYWMSLAEFNTALASPVSYTLNADGVSVLYVYDQAASGTLNIRNTITSNNVNRRLLIITARPIRILKDVGFAVATDYLIGAQPNIQASLITASGITIDGDPAVETDLPLMLQGPLVSLLPINFNRDLGYSNDNYPATSVKAFNRYLYYLTLMERANDIYRSYTGLGIYDSQWVYEE